MGPPYKSPNSFNTNSLNELAKQLGISIPKAYELTKTPGFPAIRIGSRIIIPIDEYKKMVSGVK
ncbi:MAG TPA: excisionase [Firmicutes bacterium]|nr:excisionase [Bacillota bacterium]HAX00320.1 excisionase [Bacillota bacterium]